MADLDFIGFEENILRLERLGRDVEKVDNKALKVGGNIIKKYQIANVNRSKKDQSHIQDNITVGKPKITDEGKLVEVGPNKRVEWRAKFLEYGTSKMPAYPFIEKGGDQGENEAIKAMKKVYLGALRE